METFNLYYKQFTKKRGVVSLPWCSVLNKKSIYDSNTLIHDLHQLLVSQRKCKCSIKVNFIFDTVIMGWETKNKLFSTLEIFISIDSRNIALFIGVRSMPSKRILLDINYCYLQYMSQECFLGDPLPYLYCSNRFAPLDKIAA